MEVCSRDSYTTSYHEEGCDIYDTGKSLSEALLIAEHVVYKNCSECQKQFLYTQHVLPRYELGIFM